MTHTVLGVKISSGYNFTSYTILGHFELEFQGGTHRYDTWALYGIYRHGGTILGHYIENRGKSPSSGPKVARFCEGTKKKRDRVREGDSLTHKQDASMTVGKVFSSFSFLLCIAEVPVLGLL